VVDVDLRREGELPGAEVMLELLEEGDHLLLEGALDVDHVVQAAPGAVGGDAFLVAQLGGGRRDLGGEFFG
jgi:hypothetical protein